MGVKKKESTDGCWENRRMEGLVDGMMNIMKEHMRIREKKNIRRKEG